MNKIVMMNIHITTLALISEIDMYSKNRTME